MPFHQIYPGSLTAQSISRYAPAASGVFGISSANNWLHIGETDNIQLTLLSLLDRQQEPVTSQKLVGFAFELCDAGSRLSPQQRLRQEYAATAVSF